MAAHRYWRLYVTAAYNHGRFAIAELWMATSTGGANVCTGGTGTSSSDIGGYPGSNAFDGDLATVMITADALPGTPQWVKYDFGSGNDKDVTEIRITSRATWRDMAPKDWKLQWSDNDTDWTDSITVAGLSWLNYSQQTQYFTNLANNPADKRAWRILVTAQNGNTQCYIAEIEMRATTGGADLTGSGTMLASSILHEAQAASKAFDNDTETYWASITGAIEQHWILHTFAADQGLAQLTIRSRGAFEDAAPQDFQIQWATGIGQTWETTYSVTGQTGWNTAGETRAFISGWSSARPVVCFAT